ncbi:MAG TPA: ABC transporter ATP-binding protein [Candidatus Hydrogenedentes bacterium]|nr:ABC transporter ATP-binding protein [Candidatus Hydrogenedentota bacterium]
MVKIDRLTKVYRGSKGNVDAVTDVSLHIEPGAFVAVQGPSGCGKTTLLLAIGALLKPTDGTIHVAGQDPYALGIEARARFRAAKIGFVFQQFHLVPFLDVRDNVLAPALALPQEGAAQRADELIEYFGMSDRTHHVPAELSVGERQRTALARALLNRPSLLLADEPTGNLDTANAEVVLKHLAEFAEGGGSVLLVTHDPRAAGYAHRMLHMEQGRVVEHDAKKA